MSLSIIVWRSANYYLPIIDYSAVRLYAYVPYNMAPQIPTGWPKMAPFLYALISNINRFSKLHCQNQEKICNNTITKDLITPQVCRYTTL